MARLRPAIVVHYHEIGLLPEPARGTDDRRRYGYDDMIRLLWIRRMADAGIALDDIRTAVTGPEASEADGDHGVAAVLERLEETLAAQEAAYGLTKRRFELGPNRTVPTLVFFFDEAHLLFSDAPPVLVEKIEQVVRLIRSKGIGVYFVTQNPADVPPLVLGQLGNRVQHALRAFTPRDQKAVKVAAETLRPNPSLDTEQAITELAVGEALVSVADEPL